jgi:hypothetical protein
VKNKAKNRTARGVILEYQKALSAVVVEWQPPSTLANHPIVKRHCRAGRNVSHYGNKVSGPGK